MTQYGNPLLLVNNKVYWPKHEDIDRHLKVECTPILKDIEYPPIFAVSSPVSAGIAIKLCPYIYIKSMSKANNLSLSKFKALSFE